MSKTGESDRELLRRYHEGGDPAAREVLVERHLPLVRSLARRYAGRGESLEDIEADVIRFALQHYRGHMSEVSRKLGIGRSTLYRKLKDLGLDDGQADSPEAAA